MPWISSSVPSIGSRNPLERALWLVGGIFLADHAVTGKLARDQLAQPALDRAVDVCDRRRVVFRLGREPAFEHWRCYAPGFVGEGHRGGVVAFDIARRQVDAADSAGIWHLTPPLTRGSPSDRRERRWRQVKRLVGRKGATVTRHR